MSNSDWLLEIFNTTPEGVWTKEFLADFMSQYKLLAAAINTPIRYKIKNSDIRKSVKVVKGSNNTGTKFTIMASSAIKLGEVTKESVEGMIDKISNEIIQKETAAINNIKETSDNISMYISEDYMSFEDPTLIKIGQIGTFGWETIVLVGDTDA
jgi:methylaspartate ammonia-lyase